MRPIHMSIDSLSDEAKAAYWQARTWGPFKNGTRRWLQRTAPEGERLRSYSRATIRELVARGLFVVDGQSAAPLIPQEV
jgi:hypothetical protein